MSHYSTLRTRLVSADHLLKALADLGFPRVEVHDDTVPLRNAFGFKTSDSAHIVIRKNAYKNIINDFGFRKDENGTFNLIMAAEEEDKLGTAWFARLNQRYGYHVAMDTMQNQGFSLADEVREQDGSIRLVLRRMT